MLAKSEGSEVEENLNVVLDGGMFINYIIIIYYNNRLLFTFLE